MVLSVPWSAYAIRAKSVVDQATESLERYGIRVVVADEEQPEVAQWLESFDYGPPRGYGSVFVLEHGEVQDAEHHVCDMTVPSFIRRIGDTWPAVLGLL